MLSVVEVSPTTNEMPCGIPLGVSNRAQDVEPLPPRICCCWSSLQQLEVLSNQQGIHTFVFRWLLEIVRLRSLQGTPTTTFSELKKDFVNSEIP